MYVESQKTKNVNSLMRDINGLTDEIYESLMDDDKGATLLSISALTTLLLDLSKTIDDEQ